MLLIVALLIFLTQQQDFLSSAKSSSTSNDRKAWANDLVLPTVSADDKPKPLPIVKKRKIEGEKVQEGIAPV